MDPEIVVPTDTVSVTIGTDGTVSVLQAGETQSTEIGTIQLARFINPGGLRAVGKNLFESTDASGEPTTGAPASEGLGTVAQGFVEMGVRSRLPGPAFCRTTLDAVQSVPSASDTGQWTVLAVRGYPRRVAADLFLSQKTVETHLRNIFHKVGVTSRVDLARAVERADRAEGVQPG